MDLWQKKKLIVICVIVVICSALSIWQSTPGKLEEGVIKEGEHLAETKTKGVTVYVSGEVLRPGMYEVPAGSRALEAIEKAGGMTTNANVNKVNLARKCKDGLQINVPALTKKQLQEKAGQNYSKRSLREQAGSAQKEQVNTVIVNLNTADINELESLPGVGQATAQKIIDYREKQHFSKIEDIMNVKGIGKEKFAKMKEFLEV